MIPSSPRGPYICPDRDEIPNNLAYRIVGYLRARYRAAVSLASRSSVVIEP